MVSDSNGKRWRNTGDDVLTINLAPLNASCTSQLSEAVLEFSFGKKSFLMWPGPAALHHPVPAVVEAKYDLIPRSIVQRILRVNHILIRVP
jgi:hypothetical protein